MENLTHTLVGLMLARVGLEKTTVRGAGMMMLAANAPDIDAVTWFGGNTVYLDYHRGFTHTLAFMPVMALLPLLLVRAKFTWKIWLASMVGVLSHLLIDWTSSFGIPLLIFSARRWRLDLVNLVDIWIWVILLGSLAATYLIGLVNREIGDRRPSGARRHWAWAALLMLFSFQLLRFVLHARAVATMEARLYEGASSQRVTASSNAFDPWQWRGVIETQNGENAFVWIAPVNLRQPFDPGRGRRYPVATHIPEIDLALQTRPFIVFRRFAQLPYWQYSRTSEGIEVALLDLRFGDPGNLGFGAVHALVAPNGQVIFTERSR